MNPFGDPLWDGEYVKADEDAAYQTEYDEELDAFWETEEW